MMELRKELQMINREIKALAKKVEKMNAKFVRGNKSGRPNRTKPKARKEPGVADTDKPDTGNPNSIWNVIYHGKSVEQIKAYNPFASKDWLKNTAAFSQIRRKSVEKLIGGLNEVTLDKIRARSQNEGRYAAFRAIAHGLAEWDENQNKLIVKDIY
jgi:hypothetical protein